LVRLPCHYRAELFDKHRTLLSHGGLLQVEGLLHNMDNDISLKAFDVMPLAQSMTWKFDRTIFTEIRQALQLGSNASEFAQLHSPCKREPRQRSHVFSSRG
jgi:hypothetical protein